jgi:hypothetical protein
MQQESEAATAEATVAASADDLVKNDIAGFGADKKFAAQRAAEDREDFERI